MLVILSIGLVSVLLLDKYTKLRLDISKKILAVSLALFFALRFFAPQDPLVTVFNILLIDIDTPINAFETFIPGMSEFLMIFLLVLRLGYNVIVAFLIVIPFFNNKHFERISLYFGTPMIILTSCLFLIFRDSYFYGLSGTYVEVLKVFLRAEVGLCLLMTAINDISYFKNKKYKDKSKIHYTLIIFVLSVLMLLPLNFISAITGYVGVEALDFNIYHIIVIVVPFAATILIYAVMHKKDDDSKFSMLMLMSVASLIDYYAYTRDFITEPPLHLCSFAVIVLFFALVFNNKTLFYFSYFANVFGAFAALIIPNYVGDIIRPANIHYYYNHFFAFVLPLSLVSLHRFEKPNVLAMLKAIGMFTIYFPFTAFFNAYFDRDYFFTNSTFIVEKFDMLDLYKNNIFEITVNDKLLTFHYVYLIVYFLIFIFAMFLTWFIYDFGYETMNKIHRLRSMQRYNKEIYLELKKALDGRDVKEPILPEGVNMIKIVNFSKRYGNSNKLAVDHLNLEIESGEIYGFLGHNGAGKSTTIKSLVGIQTITEGDMIIEGYSIKSQSLDAKLKIGYVSDNHAVYEKLSGREYINYIADLYKVSKEDRDKRLSDMVVEFNLVDAIDNQVKTYSHGMKQKLVVIASLIHNPKVWILDEPLTGLDPMSAYQLKQKMFNYAKNGNIVFFSSHVIEIVEKICDRIAIITNGKLKGVYKMQDLKDEKVSLESLYLDKFTESEE
ncbi:MAG: YwaF family protein [Acholeplasmatales bacterium]|nr:YwaF family protein [Acholeplasmatales bacterium]